MARHFNGTTDVIDAGVINLDFVQRNIMATCWVKPDSFPAIGSAVFGRWDNSPAEQWYLGFDGSGHIFGVILDAGAIGHSVAGSTVVSTGVWSLIGMTYNGAALQVWLNAAVDGTLAFGGNMRQNSTLHILIGAKGDGNPFPGAVAECSIWNVVSARTQLAFTAMLEGVSPYDCDAMVASAGHSAYWPLLGSDPEIEPATISITGTTVVDHPPVRTQVAFRF
jgi:Concanavalin A-like lectin/glucanases superfamily